TVAGLYRQPPRLITKAGELDLDDIRSPLPQRRRGLRALYEQPGLHDLHPIERTHGKVLVRGTFSQYIRDRSVSYVLQEAGKPCSGTGGLSRLVVGHD